MARICAIIMVTKAMRLPFLKSVYLHRFADVRFVVTEQCTPGSHHTICERMNMSNHTERSLQHTRYASWFGNFHSFCDGILFFHMDMFVNVAHLRTFDLTRNWVLRDGFPKGGTSPKCFLARSKDRNKWFWWDKSRSLCSDACARTNISHCCYGWSDMFYIARSHIDRAAFLFFKFRKVHHEVAVPTILHSMGSPVVLRCLGGCCVRNVVPNTQTLCSHRIDLTSEKVRRIMINLAIIRFHIP